jgi:homoserine kinase
LRSRVCIVCFFGATSPSSLAPGQQQQKLTSQNHTTATSPKTTQGLPLGSGMGSSAASAAAAAWAVNGLFGCPLSKDALVTAGLASEAAVSGYHADNVGPALLGGFVLVR